VTLKLTVAPSTSGENIEFSPDTGITVETSSFTIALDPRKAVSSDYSFVSHAHIDHVHSADGRSKVLASKETAQLASVRGYDLGETIDVADGIDLVDSGHILGSKAILINDRVFYTGDVSSRDRAFLKGCKGIKCDTLIMETTYGRSHYIFPKVEDVVRRVNSFIARCFDRGRPVVLTGYPLGKAQLISYFFKSWEPVYLHDSIDAINSAHVDLGVSLRHYPRFEQTKSFAAKLSRGPWLMIAPMSGVRSSFIKSLREGYNAAVAAFSGWAADIGYRRRLGLDDAYEMSDHCDFNELVELAKYCNPSKVYTVHGFEEEFAKHLQSLGFDAEPLSNLANPRTISNYV
jgi:putative mRNA 3-end processing factor